MQHATVMLNVSFSIVAASLIFLLSIHYDWCLDGMDTGFIRFVFFALIVSAVFTLKFLVLRFCGYLFNLGREMSTYIFNVFIINNLLGPSPDPRSCTYFVWKYPRYHNPYFYRIGPCISCLPVPHWPRNSYCRKLPGFSPFYLFLYLCALEIAPLLVLVRLVSKQ